MADDDGAVPVVGAMAVQPAMFRNAAHTVPVLEGCGPHELLKTMDEIREATLDPMAPLDFGIDLNEITGVTEHGTLGLTASPLRPPPPPSVPSSLRPLDFGVVPSEPLRDGMVPAFPGHYSPELPSAAAGLQHTAPTARALGSALFWSFNYTPQSHGSDAALFLGPAADAGPDIVLPSAPDVPAAKAPCARTNYYFDPKDTRSRAEIVARWREKKTRRLAAGRRPGGVVQYESRKRTALVKPRVNGKFVTPEVYEKHLVEQGKLQMLHTVPTAE